MRLASSLVVACLLLPSVAAAQIPRISVTVDATVTREGSDFVYEYTLRNSDTSTQPIQSFMLEVDAKGTVTPVSSPEGWTFGTYVDRPFISWDATGGLPEGEDDGAAPVPPNPFALRPGAILRGFKIRSPFPDQSVRFFAEAYVAVPAVEDVEDLPADLKAYFDADVTQRAFSGTVSGPKSPSDCNSQGGDADADTICDAVDNCPVFANPDQRNSGGVANLFDPMGAAVDRVGDACQCGDVNDDGKVNRDDLIALQEALADTRTSIPGDLKCSLGGVPSAQGFPEDCDQTDATTLNDILTNGRDIGLVQMCRAALIP